MTLHLTALVAGFVASFVMLGLPAQAQSWPQRPVRWIIPFGPGAGADIGARLIQEKLQEKWGQPVVIDNRPGGDSMIAIQAVLSANDDHTFLWAPSGNFTVHPYLYKRVPYNPDGLIPVARFSSTILALGIPETMPVKTVGELATLGRAKDGTLNSAAVPGITELAFDYFAHSAKFKTQRVPYRDVVQAANDLAENRIQIYSASYAMLRPQHQAGRVRVLAQFGAERAPSLPDIPTGREAGFPELEMDGNIGLFATRAVPAALIERIAADILAVSQDKAVSDRLNATAQQPSFGGAKAFADSITRQRTTIATIAKTLNIQPER